MVYVIEGDIVLISRSVLEKLGCIPKHFPRVGELLDYEDKSAPPVQGRGKSWAGG